MNTGEVLEEVRGSVALLTLNRPAKLNAWTDAMHADLVAAVVRANANADVGAIVLTGAGRGFCAGADIDVQLTDRSAGDHGAADTTGRDWVNLVRSSKPMVAAINGPAVGVGLALALAMDQLVAASDAVLSLRFIRMGLVPELASSYFLVQRCGWGTASDLALSGRTVTGDVAERIGLVDRSTTAVDLLPTALDLAAEYAVNPDRQLRMTKHLLTVNAVRSDLEGIHDSEEEALRIAFATPEHREAIAAFAEKRSPRFGR